MHKKILLVSRHAPYGRSTAREAIDIAIAASVYDQNIGILFMDDGVFQLLSSQDSQYIGQKNMTSLMNVLTLYGIENIYVHQESLDIRMIKNNQLILDDLELLDNNEIGNLLSQQDHLLSF